MRLWGRFNKMEQLTAVEETEPTFSASFDLKNQKSQELLDSRWSQGNLEHSKSSVHPLTVELAKKQHYERLKREMRDVYNSRLNELQRNI